ncbi:MAG: class I SAM-dependent methyltransferase [Candidatus Nanohaloarchaea archaeon]
MGDCREIHDEKTVERMAESHAMEKLPEGFKNKLAEFTEIVGSGRILDAGCGHGRDVNFFSDENGFNALGLDHSRNMINYAKEYRSGDFICDSLENADFSPGSFSGIWCNTVMQYFSPEESSEILEKFASWLISGGVLYVTFRLFIQEKHDNRAYTRDGEDITRYRLTPEEAEKLLENSGFEILEASEEETNDPILSFFCRKA